MTTQIDKDSKIVITGASGFVASAIVDLLIKRGYTNLHGSVRDLQDPSKTAHLREQFPQLQLFEADLTKAGSFDAGIKGAAYVIHVATPALFQSEDNQRLIIDPAVNGTLDVLRAAQKAGDTVKRFIYTSSIVAITQIEVPKEKTVYTENDWNTDADVVKTPYNLSKKLAEKAAWKFIEEEHVGFDLVSLNPAVISGPPVSSRVDQFSVGSFLNLLNGEFRKTGAPVLEYGIVDVRDVALAHVLAIETPGAQGRYILSSEEPLDYVLQGQLLQKEEEFKGYLFPETRLGEYLGTVYVSNEKARKELGLELRDPRTTLADTARAVIKLGLLPPASSLKPV